MSRHFEVNFGKAVSRLDHGYNYERSLHMYDLLRQNFAEIQREFGPAGPIVRGDFLSIKDSTVLNCGICIYNGEKIVPLSTDIVDEGHLPPEFEMLQKDGKIDCWNTWKDGKLFTFEKGSIVWLSSSRLAEPLSFQHSIYSNYSDKRPVFWAEGVVEGHVVTFILDEKYRFPKQIINALNKRYAKKSTFDFIFIREKMVRVQFVEIRVFESHLLGFEMQAIYRPRKLINLTIKAIEGTPAWSPKKENSWKADVLGLVNYEFGEPDAAQILATLFKIFEPIRARVENLLVKKGFDAVNQKPYRNGYIVFREGDFFYNEKLAASDIDQLLQ